MTLHSQPSARSAACPPARGHKTLEGFRVDREGVNLLLHAADADQPAHGAEGLFGVSAVAVRAAGFDFALLWHSPTARLWPEDTLCCLYPGSPELKNYEQLFPA